MQDGLVRIGELSRRVGVAPELLRAWESRYSLLEPSRSPGGFRLYSPDDEQRVRAMRANLDRGYSAAEAARLVLAAGPEPAVPRANAGDAEADARELQAALDDYDDARANHALDRMLAALSLDTVLRAVLTYLHELGERWERGEAERCPGTLREQRAPRPPPRARPRLGPGPASVRCSRALQGSSTTSR